MKMVYATPRLGLLKIVDSETGLIETTQVGYEDRVLILLTKFIAEGYEILSAGDMFILREVPPPPDPDSFFIEP